MIVLEHLQNITSLTILKLAREITRYKKSILVKYTLGAKVIVP